MQIQVLGRGCSRCVSTIERIQKVAREAGVAVQIDKVDDPDEIVRLGATSTPAVRIDGRIVHSGGIPTKLAVQGWLQPSSMGFLQQPTRHVFFTGKGGVGKTSVATATALALADAGKRVLLVSTDAASNLDEMLGVELRNTPTPVPGVPGLSVLNIDPEVAAESYRQRVIAQMAATADAAAVALVREQLSGACTTEIAAFDEFAGLLADGLLAFDHVVFDTAPTGHTLRLLSLPQAWSGFLAGNDRGASCLGPHSGLKLQEARFQAAMAALSDPARTTVILVARPDQGALAEAARTATELHALGLHNQRLVVNGVFAAGDPGDTIATAIATLGQQALAAMPASLAELPQDRVPLRAFDTVGLPALRALLATRPAPPPAPATASTSRKRCTKESRRTPAIKRYSPAIPRACRSRRLRACCPKR